MNKKKEHSEHILSQLSWVNVFGDGIKASLISKVSTISCKTKKEKGKKKISLVMQNKWPYN